MEKVKLECQWPVRRVRLPLATAARALPHLPRERRGQRTERGAHHYADASLGQPPLDVR